MAHEQNKFCPYPWISLCARTDTVVAPCDLSLMSFEGIQPFPSPETVRNRIRNSEDLKKLRRDLLNGVQNPNCRRCWKAEESGLPSLRQQTGNFFAHDIEWARAVTAPDGEYHGETEFFDVRAGHKCNLKCRTCSVYQSSAWIADHEFLTGERFNSGGRDLLWGENPEVWRNLFAGVERSLSSVEKIHIMFVGGEPLLETRHQDFLLRCEQAGFAPRIELRYTSNITVLPDAVLERWRAFAKVFVGASIDGVAAVNDYVRYPSRWKAVEANLLKLIELDHVLVWVQPCASIYNIYDLPDVYEWARDRRQNYLGQKIPFGVYAHVVHDPAHLNIGNLPPSALEALHRRSEMMPAGPGREFIDGALQFARQSARQGRGLADFWDFTQKLDLRRGQSFLQSVPQWSRILQANGLAR